MSCGSEYETQNCITDTLLAIVEAQDRVDHGHHEGATGCNRAIQELIGGIKTSGYDTIPIILQLKCTGLPFIGFGAVRENVAPSTSSLLHSAVFRVEDVDPENNCASLELLKSSSTIPYITDSQPTSASVLFDMQNEVLTCTDAFITVDLSAFVSVSCLPPITLT